MEWSEHVGGCSQHLSLNVEWIDPFLQHIVKLLLVVFEIFFGSRLLSFCSAK